MMASLGRRPHALVFTDAIGETEPALRAAACEPFVFLGAALDREKSARSGADANLASDNSTVRVLVIKCREAWQIVRECHARLHASSSA